MTFHVGQKVEYIRGRKTDYERAYGETNCPHEIVPGGIYTVRDVDVRAADLGWPIVLRFEEFAAKSFWCPELQTVWELGFPGDCFRPVVDNKTDISIFTAMLNPDRVMAHSFNDHDSILNQT